MVWLLESQVMSTFTTTANSSPLARVCDWSTKLIDKYDDVEITIRNTYLKTPLNDKNIARTFLIKNKRFNSRFGFDEMIKLGKAKESKWAMVPFSIVKTHIKMISSLLMYKSVLLLSHQQYLSIYDLRYKSWV